MNKYKIFTYALFSSILGGMMSYGFDTKISIGIMGSIIFHHLIGYTLRD